MLWILIIIIYLPFKIPPYFTVNDLQLECYALLFTFMNFRYHGVFRNEIQSSDVTTIYQREFYSNCNVLKKY